MADALTSHNCPMCKAPADNLVPVDTALRVALHSTGMENIPGFVCGSCYAELSGQVSQGLRLRIEQENREKNKLMLWKNRVNLIKQGRNLMAQKAYSEAAVTYEKYLRVLELVYNLQKGQLTPAVFNNSKRSKELTVVASVYWDLMRIYDTSPRYGDRMGQAATKLAQFLPFSTIYPDVMKKAESFVRTANNANVVKNFIRATKSRGSRCFIATAVFDSPVAEEVFWLRQYRDQFLRHHGLGRRFILFYYRFSPPVADWIDSRAWIKRILRPPLRKIALWAKKSLNSSALSMNSNGHGNHKEFNVR